MRDISKIYSETEHRIYSEDQKSWKLNLLSLCVSEAERDIVKELFLRRARQDLVRMGIDPDINKKDTK